MPTTLGAKPTSSVLRPQSAFVVLTHTNPVPRVVEYLPSYTNQQSKEMDINEDEENEAPKKEGFVPSSPKHPVDHQEEP